MGDEDHAIRPRLVPHVDVSTAPNLLDPPAPGPAITLPAEGVRLCEATTRLNDLARRLRRLNRLRARYQGEAQSLVACARSLYGLAVVTWRSAHSSPDLIQHRRFIHRASSLQRSLLQHIDPINPIESTHHEYLELVKRLATQICDVGASNEYIHDVQVFAADARVGLPLRMAVLNVLLNALADAFAEVEFTEKVPRAADLALEAMRGDSSTLLGKVKDALDNANEVSDATLKLVALVARYDIARLAREESAASSIEELIECLTRGIPSLAGRPAQAMRTAVREPTEHNLNQVSERVEAALSARPKVLVAKGIVSYLILIAVYREGAETPPRGFEESMRWGLSLTVATGEAAAATLRLFNSAGRIVPRPATGLRSALRLMGRAAKDLERPLAMLGGILSIVNGVHDICTGLERGDDLSVVVGGLEVSSGAALALGEMLALECLTPLGTVLGLVVIAIELIDAVQTHHRSPSQQYAEDLIESIRNQRATGNRDQRPIIERLGLLRALQDLAHEVNEWPWWSVRQHNWANLSDEENRTWEQRTRAFLGRFGFGPEQIERIWHSLPNRTAHIDHLLIKRPEYR